MVLAMMVAARRFGLPCEFHVLPRLSQCYSYSLCHPFLRLAMLNGAALAGPSWIIAAHGPKCGDSASTGGGSSPGLSVPLLCPPEQLHERPLNDDLNDLNDLYITVATPPSIAPHHTSLTAFSSPSAHSSFHCQLSHHLPSHASCHHV